MKRKNITIREDQAEWVENSGVNLSNLVQQAIDEAMGPTEDELAQAYRENAEHAATENEDWAAVSREANDHLGPSPGPE